ncbi:COX assembly mitochondrial protein homolog [Oppia nitens]|uniref:COX assembly mitochondrial protein homolog n=1 Tax=Oppia nitens TaxID=1686743 RepID=UPI0023D9B269|nr:COX assembly mitochondrial protein homolog [Oppia nitens]
MASVLSPNQSTGPKGLGDPEDKTLRKVEEEVLIPKIMRDLAKKEKCTEFVKAFEECCKKSSLLMVVKCRTENTRLKNCLSDWYNNEDFRHHCQEIYLNERSEYRRTGVKSKTKRMS